MKSAGSRFGTLSRKTLGLSSGASSSPLVQSAGKEVNLAQTANDSCTSYLKHTANGRMSYRGFDAQVNGAMIGIPQFRRVFGYTYKGQQILPASWQSAFNGISSVGQFFGGFICSWFSDRTGRRWSLFLGLMIVTSGIFGEVFSSTRVAFLFSKLVLGIGLGFYLTIGPLYASEIAPLPLRGIVTGGINLAICTGQLLSNAVIKGFGGRDDAWAFRAPLATQWLFVAIMLPALPFAPESPWYFVKRGDQAGAERSLKQLYGQQTDVRHTLAVITRTIEADIELSNSSKWIQCFQGTNLVRTMVSVGVFACQHLSGIIFALGYSTYFFELAGIELSHAFDLGIGVTAIGVVGCMIAWSLMNNWGRRKLFMLGMVGMTVVMLLMGILDVVPTAGARWAQALCTVVYALFYQATIGPLAFAILGETSTPMLRAKTIGLATACQALFSTIFNIVIAYMISPNTLGLKGKVGFVFGGLGAMATLWSWLYVPELKGRTFADIDSMFQNHVKARHMAKYQTAVAV